MKRYFVCLFLAVLVLLGTDESVFSQKTADSAKPTLQGAEFENIKNIAHYVSAIQDGKTSALSFGQIADAVWKRDEEYARSLFLISLNRAVVKENDSVKEVSLKNAAYRKIISLIARHDPNWAKALIKSFAAETDKRAGTNLEVADSLIESDPKLAADFADQSSQIEITDGLLWFLKSLRQKDANEANRLFLQILNRYPQQANVDVKQFAFLGTYLFTSPHISPQDYQNISLTRVGNIIFPNITVNLPNVPLNLIQSYIKSAVFIINRPTGDDLQRQFKYALGYLLLPKAQEFAPNLIGELGGAMAALTSFMPPELTSDDAFSNIKKKPNGSFTQRIEEIEKLADSYTRDRLFLDVVAAAWRQNDFATAKLAAAKIENEPVKSDLEILILFGEAKNLLRNKEADLFTAMRMTEKLPTSFEKSLLWLGAASVAEKTKQTSFAADALDSALKTAGRLNDENTPFILLSVAGQTAKTDAFQARTILTDAVKSFNKYENVKKPLFAHKITLEPLTIPFPLEIDAVNLDFQNSFEKAIKGNEENGIQIIADLKDEQLKGQAYVALVKSFVARKPAESSASDQRIVTVGEDGIRKSAVKTVMPIYPKDSLKKQAKGVGVAEVQYDGNGEVSDVKILESPDAETGKSVVHAMRQWKFNPSKLNGEPVSIRGKITFYFVVDAKGKGEVKNPKQFQ